MAVACPVTGGMTKFTDSSDSMNSMTIILQPTCSKINSATCSLPLEAHISSSLLLTSSKKLLGTQVNRAVITVQTFKNRFTGPMLYIFTRHYQRLGYAVIVFDRFANHKDVFAENFHETKLMPRVHYYGYTMFEKMFPNIYNSSYNEIQVN